MSKHGNTPGLHEYLDASGVLVNGTEEDIKAARKAYRKQYKTAHKRKERQENKEVGVLLSRRNREFDYITAAAKKHSMSVPAFLKMATLAYLDKTFLSPNRELVARLAGMLSDCLNEVQQIAQAKGRLPWHVEEKCNAIERRIIQLEAEITRTFSEPPAIEDAVRSAIAKDADLRFRLLHFLTSTPSA